MQPILRNSVDADRFDAQKHSSVFATEQFRHEIKCGICFDDYYVDNITHENVCRAIDQGLDNPFVCEECSVAYDDDANDVR
jgi:hypothetical protein